MLRSLGGPRLWARVSFMYLWASHDLNMHVWLSEQIVLKQKRFTRLTVALASEFKHIPMWPKYFRIFKFKNQVMYHSKLAAGHKNYIICKTFVKEIRDSFLICRNLLFSTFSSPKNLVKDIRHLVFF